MPLKFIASASDPKVLDYSVYIVLCVRVWLCNVWITIPTLSNRPLFFGRLIVIHVTVRINLQSIPKE